MESHAHMKPTKLVYGDPSGGFNGANGQGVNRRGDSHLLDWDDSVKFDKLPHSIQRNAEHNRPNVSIELRNIVRRKPFDVFVQLRSDANFSAYFYAEHAKGRYSLCLSTAIEPGGSCRRPESVPLEFSFLGVTKLQVKIFNDFPTDKSKSMLYLDCTESVSRVLPAAFGDQSSFLDDGVLWNILPILAFIYALISILLALVAFYRAKIKQTWSYSRMSSESVKNMPFFQEEICKKMYASPL